MSYYGPDQSRSSSRDRDRDRDRGPRDYGGDRDRDRGRDSRDNDRDRGGRSFSHQPGGRGGGRGGGGRGGRGDMSWNSAVQDLLRGKGMSNEDILLNVLQLPEEDIASREVKAEGSGSLIPPFEDWRYSRDVGVRLNRSNDIIIRSNHFHVDVSRMPGTIFQYHVHYCRYSREGILEDELTTNTEKDTKNRKQKDYRLYTTLMKQWREMHKDWFVDASGRQRFGFCFDGLNTVFTTEKLPWEGEFFREDVLMPTVNPNALSTDKYQLTLTLTVDGIVLPQSKQAWKDADIAVLRALDCSLFDFARWQQIETDPRWVSVGSKVFPASEKHLELTNGIHAMRGYYMALKTCQAGLVLVSDLVVTAFLNSGDMLVILSQLGTCRNVEEFLADFKRGLPDRKKSAINSSIKGIKIRTHLGYTVKSKGLGPAANSNDSLFEYEGSQISVAQYMKVRYGITLKYPGAPTINIGSAKRQVLMPAELCSVPVGQVRSKPEPDIVAQLIRHAAVKPDERLQFIMNGQLIPELRKNDATEHFGVSKIGMEPLTPEAVLLPPAHLQYANKVVNPGLQGNWAGGQFIRKPPEAVDGRYHYGVLVVDSRGNEWRGAVESVTQGLRREADITGVRLSQVGDAVTCESRPDDLHSAMSNFISRHKARFIVVVLCGDVYQYVKLAADRLGVVTQCIRLDKIRNKIPSGYFSNVMLKINVKLGGTNHTICSRYEKSDLEQIRDLVASGEIDPIFQDPPASLCWIFDKHCMIVGIDVSHPEPSAKGSSREEPPSIAAVVGTVDGSASQYVCHVQAQGSRLEVVDCLTEAMFSLLGAFRERNGGEMPKHLLVYRDGVGESQFDMILENELTSIQDAVAMQKNHSGVKIAFVVCQKAHHARFACETRDGFANLCPGVVIDGSSSNEDGVTSTKMNEFYLNSHTAIQGTGKATKYSLIYDEINMKMIELELLSYWLTYMYCRCNRSVSVCTPVYYAHWAARRARYLLSAGADIDELKTISQEWSSHEHGTMFFV